MQPCCCLFSCKISGYTCGGSLFVGSCHHRNSSVTKSFIVCLCSPFACENPILSFNLSFQFLPLTETLRLLSTSQSFGQMTLMTSSASECGSECHSCVNDKYLHWWHVSRCFECQRDKFISLLFLPLFFVHITDV